MASEAIWLCDERDSARFFAPIFDANAAEQLIVAHLAADRRVLGTGSYLSQCPVSINVPLRELIGDMLRYDSKAMVIAHSHPSGDPVPSEADIEITHQIAGMLRPLGIRLLDHLVFAEGGEWTSFRRIGWL
ncbi:MAG: DNA repair protein [Sphingomonadaceae bacterium]|nr:DNA repair protein [Sphingomonadaceae bacterium]